MTFGRHAVSFPHVSDESPDIDDIAGKLVTDNEGRPASAARPVVPVEDMHIGAAHTGAADTYQHLVFADPWLGYVPQYEPRTRRFLDQSFHECAWSMLLLPLKVTMLRIDDARTSSRRCDIDARARESCCALFLLLLYSRVVTNSMRVMLMMS